MNNNDLSMLLKAQVIELKAKLDISESMGNIREDIKQIAKQVDSSDLSVQIPVELFATLDDLNKDITAIQKRIKGSNNSRKVELGVKLDANISDLQADIKGLQTKLQNSKSVQPIKLNVEINIKGSASKIKEQFDSIQKILQDFQKGYGGKLDSFSKEAGDAIGNLVPKEAIAKVNSSIEGIRKSMSESFGEGTFSTKTFADASGNLDSLVATMRRADGEIQTISHDWNSDKQAFVPVKQQHVDQTEANMEKVRQSIGKVVDSLDKLNTTGATDSIRQKAEAMLELDKASMDNVTSLQALVKAEAESQRVSKAREIAYESLNTVVRSLGDSSKYTKDGLNSFNEDIVSAKTVSDIRAVETAIKSIGDSVKEENVVNGARSKLLSDIIQKENQITQLKIKSSGMNSESMQDALRSADALAKESREIAESATSTKELSVARDNLNRITKEYISTANTELSQVKNNEQVFKRVDEIEKALRKLREMKKLEADVIDGVANTSGNTLKQRMADLDQSASEGLQSLERYGRAVKEELDDAEREARELIKPITLIDQTTKDLAKRETLSKILGAVDANDKVNLEKYIGELRDGEVHTMKWKTALDDAGRAVDRLDVVMKGTGKTVERVTLDIDKSAGAGGKAIRQISEESVFNANRNLGMLEQLRVAMERVPIWAVATSTFYGFIRMTKQAVEEIMLVNGAMTELARVAGDDISLDLLLSESVDQSKELGTNIHEVLGSLGEATRTFGEFNEQALLAVNQTAIIMDNVSDLSLEDSMNSLIGTMNAFNITAEESIHIVDAFNEVDNNFAISTTQIATAMSKAGSTAKTFGVDMEESIGHITAIGSVTMESGERIGNSLKTLYSRITTVGDAKDILEEVGVAINEIGENGEVSVRGVSDILGDLAGIWDELSDSQRQNVGVTVAGRNQLSRLTTKIKEPTLREILSENY